MNGSSGNGGQDDRKIFCGGRACGVKHFVGNFWVLLIIIFQFSSELIDGDIGKHQ